MVTTTKMRHYKAKEGMPEAPKVKISKAVEQAFYDWLSGDAYASGGNNYRLKSQKSSIAPWNKEVKKIYGSDNEKFHNDATEWAKTHSTVSFKRLQFEQEHERSSYSQKQDLARQHSIAVEPSSPRVKVWLRDPGTMDIQGIDTPKSLANQIKGDNVGTLTVHREGYHRKGYTRKDGTKVAPADVPSTSFAIKDRGKPGRTPESEQWYNPQAVTGWGKDMEEDKRRLLVLNAHKGNKLASARAMLALANVTTDTETASKARRDALYFFQQHNQATKMAPMTISPKGRTVGRKLPKVR